MGPVIGPLVGGFLGEIEGWRWIQGVMTIFSGVVWIFVSLAVPETYAPVLLKRRAADLSKLNGEVYPIVFLLSFYMAVIYGTLYMLFGAYPIVYQQHRGWSPGVAGLPFIGVAIGMLLSVVYNICVDNPRVIAGAPFGFAMVLVFLSIMNYLVDSYTIYAASVLAANSVFRAVFGAVFPLFTRQMYNVHIRKFQILQNTVVAHVIENALIKISPKAMLRDSTFLSKQIGKHFRWRYL
ncbi:MFS general substrate transporter [Lasiodiplodia theobromae]|uniref:MFS general substrate transporter n=1 Tax=Lasiodiplodia theobromae TaxID=45133 RepID=UPI0015C3DC83|nr:MFS general substrate transporter [Lasiodiplodia theobromae]KAF4540658.1 MFS general substrate transporter [Lasiodiplodia theobromae]